MNLAALLVSQNSSDQAHKCPSVPENTPKKSIKPMNQIMYVNTFAEQIQVSKNRSAEQLDTWSQREER